MAIEIEMRSAESLEISEKDHRTASKVLIGIFDAVNRGLYIEGHRNNIAVDLSIASSILGFDPVDIVDCLPIDADKKYDLDDRLDIIDNYIDRWISLGPCGFMLDMDEWLLWYDNTENHFLRLIES